MNNTIDAPNCCNKPMVLIHEGSYDMSVIEQTSWFCGECGAIREEKTIALDDEEIIELAEQHPEIKTTNFYKELTK